MNNFYIDPKIDLNAENNKAIEELKQYCRTKRSLVATSVYVLSAALVGNFKYTNAVGTLVILIPGYKIMLLNTNLQQEAFTDFCEDFVEDLGYLSEKYGYKTQIGRPRVWKDSHVEQIDFSEGLNWDDYKLDSRKEKRIGELLISLLIGSVNDIEKVGIEDPDDLIQKIRKNIVLFDSDQTKFLYSDTVDKKTVFIQGLSGTGKTELLLHKLKDIYIEDKTSKIFFTCHNRTLANDLKERIPHFFDFMKVETQIEWNSRLWVDRAWGSQGDSNSGLYSYICSHYDIPFLRWSYQTSYDYIFSRALEEIKKIPKDEFQPAFDYIFVDERQDFPPIFFELCEYITSKKVYAAGDVFQNIFFNTEELRQQFDIVLNKCYRTDPRTLMFAHSIGMALFEENKLAWFEENEWQNLGYSLELLQGDLVHLRREPIRRFNEFDIDYQSMFLIKEQNTSESILKVIRNIKESFPSVLAEDIAIIGLDNDNEMFDLLGKLEFVIQEEFEWNVNCVHESKKHISGAVHLTNSNNVKGLEFPFVICFSKKIQKGRHYRNVLYTMLTRSFIQSYFIVESEENLREQEEGLRIINEYAYIETHEPTSEEKKKIHSAMYSFEAEKRKTSSEILNEVFTELRIQNGEKRRKIRNALREASQVDLMNKEDVRDFIETIQLYF